MRANQFGLAALRLHIQLNILARLPHASRIRIQEDFNSVFAQDLCDLLRNIDILAREKLPRRLNDCHSAAETPEQLAKLESNITSAQNQQMLRQRIEFHDRNIVKERYALQAGNVRPRSARARIDENVLRRDGALAAVLRVDDNFAGTAEAGLTEDQFKVGSLFQFRLATVAKVVDDVALAFPNFGHIDTDGPRLHAIISGPPHQVGDAPAGHHRLRRRASLINAGAANMFALDESSTHSGAGQSRR